jgi:hypothetical protein
LWISLLTAQPSTSANQLATVKAQQTKGSCIFKRQSQFTDSAGAFSSTFQLQPGENTLNFRAVDAAGNVTEKPVKVTFNQ